MSEVIRTRREGGVIELTLDRPKANAIDLVTRAQVSSLNLTTEDENELRDWLSGTDPESEID